MAKNWIPLRQVEGTASRQAHVRLPEGTYEREISKEGFFGPSAQFHHKHKPTDWVEFDGAIRPRAFDLNKLATAQAEPVERRAGDGQSASADAHLEARQADGRARPQQRRRPAPVHPRGRGRAVLRLRPSRLSRRRLPRDPARHDVAARAHQAHPVADGRGDQRPFHPAGEGPGRPPRDLRSGDPRHAQDRRRLPRPAGRAHLESVGEAPQPALDRDLPVQSARCGGLARRSQRRAHQLARPPAADEPSRPSAALGAHHLRGRPLRRLHLRAAAAGERPGGAAPAVLPQQRRFRGDHLLSQGQLLQPRQHPSRHDDGASLGLHARPASQGLRRRHQRRQDRDRRGRGDDRHARRGRRRRHAGRRRVRRLREVVASAAR